MPSEVIVPARMTNETMYSFLGQIFDIDGSIRDTEYIFNFERLGFIDPIGITTIANATKLLNEEQVSVYYKNFQQDTSNGVSYLRDVGFFSHFLSQDTGVPQHTKPTAFPLKFISMDAVWVVYDHHFTPWVDRCLGIDSKRQLSAIGTSIHEAFNNIKDHSTRNIACFYAQYFPKRRNIIFAISDFGVGIAHNVRKKEHCESDSHAIQLAVQNGFSTQSTPRNRGSGLDNIIKSIALNQRGHVIIYSGRGKFEAIEQNIRVLNISPSQAPYPGTMIALALYIDRLNLDEVEVDEVFSW